MANQPEPFGGSTENPRNQVRCVGSVIRAGCVARAERLGATAQPTIEAATTMARERGSLIAGGLCPRFAVRHVGDLRDTVRGAVVALSIGLADGATYPSFRL